MNSFVITNVDLVVDNEIISGSLNVVDGVIRRHRRRPFFCRRSHRWRR